MRANSTIRRASAALAVVATGLALAAPASASTSIKATGATITRSDTTAGTTLTVKATVARLDLWCSSNRLVVNKKATTIPCNKLVSVTTTGLTGNDWVEINATGFGSSLAKTALVVKTGAGNDTINVRHNGSLTVYAGAGNDRIGAGLASGSHPVSELQLGEDGNDTLTNYGFITAPKVPYDWDAASIARSKGLGSTLRGGPGADTIIGDNTRWSDVTVASNDTVDLKEGPALVSPDEGTATPPSWTYQVSSGSPWNRDTLAFGRATTLAVRCTSSTDGRGSYTVNGLRIPVPCAYHYLEVQGTDRGETFDFDQNQRNGPDRYGMGVHATLAGGDDVATIRSLAGSLTADGGTGNDHLTVGIHGAGGESGASGSLTGGAGTDTLTNLGFVDPNPPIYDPTAGLGGYDYLVQLDGGPGADRINGAATTVDLFALDPADTIVDKGGPAVARYLGTTGTDSVIVQGNDAAATTVDVLAGSNRKRITLPIGVLRLEVLTGDGDDDVSLLGRSKGTATYTDTGAGIDSITFWVRPPLTDQYSDDGIYRTITQTGYQPITWHAPNVERVTPYNPD